MDEHPRLGIIGGTGLTNFSGLADQRVIEVDTPYGKPSSPVFLGTLNGVRVAFLARHGAGHVIMPTEVNNRANIYALKSIGVRRLISISACGSLREDYAPGHVVLPDQVFDFTRERVRTFFGNGMVAHISSADPFCPQLTELVYQAVLQTGAPVHKGGTSITIEGPRFSTKAESHLYRSWGMSIIGMTTCPEIFLAREAQMCYTSIAHVTDFDVWHTSEESVNVEMIIQTLNRNIATIQESLQILAKLVPEERSCECGSSLEKAVVTDPGRIPAETGKALEWLAD